jgi:hypothetical protein
MKEKNKLLSYILSPGRADQQDDQVAMHVDEAYVSHCNIPDAVQRVDQEIARTRGGCRYLQTSSDVTWSGQLLFHVLGACKPCPALTVRPAGPGDSRPGPGRELTGTGAAPPCPGTAAPPAPASTGCPNPKGNQVFNVPPGRQRYHSITVLRQSNIMKVRSIYKKLQSINKKCVHSY